MNNRFTQLLNLKYPIIQGPFGGGLSSVELAVTCANSGILGSFGMHHLNPEQMKATAAQIRAGTSGVFAVNLWVSDHDGDSRALSEQAYQKGLEALGPLFHEIGVEPPAFQPWEGPSFEDQIKAVFEIRPPVFSFVYGVPDIAILDQCRKLNIITVGTATSDDEAFALQEAGVDAVVATGLEAGGHRVSFLRSAEDSLMGGLSLIPRVSERVHIPVIAAGGIVDSRGVKAALALGADGVQVGTAFLACQESAASDLHRRLLFGPEGRTTKLTRAFTGRLARGIENRLSQEAPALPYPLQSWFTGALKSAATLQGRWDLMSLWAGQSTPLLKHHQAVDVVAELARGFD